MNFFHELLYYGPLCEIGKKIKPLEEDVEKNTNKKYLLEEFDKMTKDIGDICHQDDVVIEYKPPDKDTYLKPENCVDISFLMKSIDKVLVGKCFLGRCISKPIQLAAIAFLMEDPSGERAVRVAIYNSSLPLASFNIGTIVTIINPYFRSLKDGSLALRSYSTNHVIILSNEEVKSRFPRVKWPEERAKPSIDCEIPSDKVLQYRKEGNKHFSNRCYVAAIECYTKALSLSPNDDGLLCNRSLCYLRMEKYNDALKDAFTVLQNIPTHVKAIHRAGSAYAGLKQFEKAKNFLTTKLELDIPKEDIQSLLKKIEEFISQRDFGRYDMVKLYASLGNNVEHEIEDYIGPVEISQVGEKGRGLKAKRDLEPGELLICCKAFAVYYRDFDPSWKVNSSPFVPLDELYHIVARKIEQNPDAAKMFYQLTVGSALDNLYQYSEVDMARIEMVVINNVIESHMPGKQSGYGIWILPSYINNDCIDANCTVTIFGNVCQVRCIKKVKKGQELLRSYIEHGDSMSHRAFQFEMKQQFACKCRLCSEESKSMITRLSRDLIVNEYVKEKMNDPSILKFIVKNIIKTDEGFPFNHYYMAMPLFEAGNLEFEMKMFQEAIVSYSQFLKVAKIGGDLVKHLHKACANLFRSFMSVREYGKANICRKELLEYVGLYLGSCDDVLLEALHPGITDLFIQLIINHGKFI